MYTDIFKIKSDIFNIMTLYKNNVTDILHIFKYFILYKNFSIDTKINNFSILHLAQNINLIISIHYYLVIK